MNQPWPAPYADEPIVTRVSIPGSKSLTNRALVLAALADSPSTLRAPLIARDTSLMADALESLGAQITRKDDAWHITPINAFTNATVDCGLAGTVMRFVPVIAALSAGSTQFDGDPRAYERPMGATISALRALGATVDDDGRETLPFTVTGGPQVTGGQLEIDASASSQFVSALLLVGARLESGLDLAHRGDSLPSLPHIEMTITELRRRGVQVDVSDSRWFVHPGPIRGVDLVIEPDLSNAGAFIAAALATGGSVAIAHWPTETDQAGAAWLETRHRVRGACGAQRYRHGLPWSRRAFGS
jgi:3-phosphoshikimate 1-carboxyvinyltransferase